MTSLRLPFSSLAAAIMATGLSSHALAQEQALGTVVVTASGFEQNIADAPASISVITREELEQQSYTSIVDAVKNIPGVSVTGGGSSKDISIRGMSPAYTLYLVDGRPISAGRSVNTNGADGGKQIGLPPLAMIERIEVIRGPMSSLYGSDAMGGVINVITRKISDKWVGQIDMEYTKSDNDVSNDGQTYDLFMAGPVVSGLLGLKINAGFENTDESDYVGGSDNAESKPETKRKRGGFEFALTPDKNNSFSFGVQTASQETNKTPGKSIAIDGIASNYKYDKDIYVLKHDGRYGNLNVNTYIQRDISEKVQDQTKKETTTTLNSQATYVSGNNIFSLGGQYRKETLDNETNGLLTAGAGGVPLPGAVASADRWIAALYGEAEWGLTDDFSLTTGARYDRDQFFGGHISPRIYGVYHWDPEWTLKGGVSTGYRQPTLAQSTAGVGTTTGGGGRPSNIPHSRALIIGNPDLKPEKSTSFEFGTAFKGLDEKTSGSLMFFYTEFKDKISEDRYCTSPNAANNNDYVNYACPFGNNNYYFLSSYENVDKAVMKGVEASFDYKFNAEFNMTSSYTLTKSEQKTGAFAGQALNKQPKHMLNALFNWNPNSELNVWLQGNYRSKTSDFLSRTSMSDGTPGYSLFDIGLVYKVSPKAKLKAGIYNLANKKITSDTYGVVLDGRTAMVGLTVDF